MLTVFISLDFKNRVVEKAAEKDSKRSKVWKSEELNKDSGISA